MALTFILLNVMNWLNQLFFCGITRKTEGNSLLKFLLKQNQLFLWQFHIQLIHLVRQKLVRQRVLWRILFSINNPFLMKVMLYWHWVYLGKIVNVILTFIPTLSFTNFRTGTLDGLLWHLWLCWRASYFISDHLLLKNLLRTLNLLNKIPSFNKD